MHRPSKLPLVLLLACSCASSSDAASEGVAQRSSSSDAVTRAGPTTMWSMRRVAAPDRPEAAGRVATAACVDEVGMAFIPADVPAQGEVDEPSDPWRVTDAFWLDKYETTVEQYRRCVDAGACDVPRSYPHKGERCTWNLKKEPNLPITCVNHLEHAGYCDFVGKRPPFAHELQWVYGNRDKKSLYPWGIAPRTCELAIVDRDTDDAKRGCGRNRPWPVGSRPADVTRDGVFDLVGNVMEMSQMAHPVGPVECGHFGGSWAFPFIAELPSGFKVNVMWDEHLEGESGDPYSGFRCAKDVGSQPPCTVAP